MQPNAQSRLWRRTAQPLRRVSRHFACFAGNTSFRMRFGAGSERRSAKRSARFAVNSAYSQLIAVVSRYARAETLAGRLGRLKTDTKFDNFGKAVLRRRPDFAFRSTAFPIFRHLTLNRAMSHYLRFFRNFFACDAGLRSFSPHLACFKGSPIIPRPQTKSCLVFAGGLIHCLFSFGFARVAQLDRVTASEAAGCGFNSRRAHHFFGP